MLDCNAGGCQIVADFKLPVVEEMLKWKAPSFPGFLLFDRRPATGKVWVPDLTQVCQTVYDKEVDEMKGFRLISLWSSCVMYKQDCNHSQKASFQVVTLSVCLSAFVVFVVQCLHRCFCIELRQCCQASLASRFAAFNVFWSPPGWVALGNLKGPRPISLIDSSLKQRTLAVWGILGAPLVQTQ